MTDDLVKRLRYLSRVFRKHDVEDLTRDDYLSAQLYPDEAADRIEQLTAERDARIEALTAQLTTARADYQIESDLREVEEALLKAAEAERDARIDPAEVQALVNAAEPMLATALASAEAERDRMREALQQFLIEYDEVDLADAEPSSLTEAVLAARAALKGESHD